MNQQRAVTVLIPAIKKEARFQDDLVKKIAGVNPIQRTLTKAIELGLPSESIFIFTDSEEIQLIGERNNISVLFDPTLSWESTDIETNLRAISSNFTEDSDYVLILSPYALLLDVNTLRAALGEARRLEIDVLKPVREERGEIVKPGKLRTVSESLTSRHEKFLVVSNAFCLIRIKRLRDSRNSSWGVRYWTVDERSLEIESLRDWWVCEKLLKRRRIVFRVIGNSQVGMGHIFRALSIAHELTDHELLFVSDHHNQVAVNELAGYDYWLGIYDELEITQKIIELQPNLVVNDILDTDLRYIETLRNAGIAVVNFEDLGGGAKAANLTINELFDAPQFDAPNVRWGHEYFFTRDEFAAAKPNDFRESVTDVLLAFGGTDQHNLTWTIYNAISDFCSKSEIFIHIVVGPGYAKFDELVSKVGSVENVFITHASGVISSIMERVQLAIASNGRTVYELAQMNVPGIVISQHLREESHLFACPENGFIPLPIGSEVELQKKVLEEFNVLVRDKAVRHDLFTNVSQFDFNPNKEKVVSEILQVLEQS